MADVDVTFELPKGTKSKEIKVQFDPKRIKVTHKGEVLLEVRSRSCERVAM